MTSQARATAIAKRKSDLARHMRRARVAELHVTKMPYRAIAKKMKEEGIVNPSTGKAYSQVTIKNDVDWLEQQAIIRAQTTMDDHRARQLDEIKLIKDRALSMDDENAGGKLALQALRLETDILGTRAPIEVNVRLITVLYKKLEIAGIDPDSFLEKTIERLT